MGCVTGASAPGWRLICGQIIGFAEVRRPRRAHPPSQPLLVCLRMKTIHKSAKLNNVLYDVRGPIVDAAKQME
ncbi:MAG: hypothetical protein EOP24_48590, partial [Hyphomicrobiales bacterium]